MFANAKQNNGLHTLDGSTKYSFLRWLLPLPLRRPFQLRPLQLRRLCLLAGVEFSANVLLLLRIKNPSLQLEKTVAPCGDWQLAYLHSVRERYMQKNPRRQMTSTDLPNFPIPKGWTNALKCWFCKEDQDCSEARNKHVRSCPQMPYNLWLRRLRVIQFAAKDSPFTCPHCGTPMFTAKAKGKHSTACATRRMNFQLPLGQETYIPDSELETPE